MSTPKESEAMSERRYLTLRGCADTSQLRTAQYEGSEHLVVPVIALIGDVVVRPLGSEGPEFVPAEELASAPAGWNNRPVMPNHPDNGRSTANEPRTLERERFGQLFYTTYEGGKLKTEAWLDVARAKRMGGDALSVVERCQRGELVEVSVGAWVTAEKRRGKSPSGEPYESVWRDIVPDHLAMLPEGVEGACSCDMGCGAPRAAQRATTEPAQLRCAEESDMGKSLIKKLRDEYGIVGAEGEGVSELWMLLTQALESAVPAFSHVEEVFPDDGAVVYGAHPEERPMLFRRGYSVSDGEVALGEDEERVEPQLSYVPVAARACACDGSCDCSVEAPTGADNQPGDGQPPEPTTMEDIEMSDKAKELIGRLIANEATPFTEAHEETLAVFGEDELEDLASRYEAAPSEPAAEPSEPADPNQVSLSREEYEDMRAASSAYKVAQRAKKERLIAALKGAQSVYTEKELEAMSVEQLEKTAKLAKLDEPERDYTLRGAAVVTEDDAARFAPPDPYKLGKAKEAN